MLQCTGHVNDYANVHRFDFRLVGNVSSSVHVMEFYKILPFIMMDLVMWSLDCMVTSRQGLYRCVEYHAYIYVDMLSFVIYLSKDSF